MAPLRQAAVCSFLALLPSAAIAQSPGPAIGLDCSVGFEGLRAAAALLPGAQAGRQGEFDVVKVDADPAWKAEYAFTPQRHEAYPAVTLRVLREQVTGVWTAESKGCGYGSTDGFNALMADMKERDSELTNASRDEVERKKRNASPLGETP